jgi:hypothetical protein
MPTLAKGKAVKKNVAFHRAGHSVLYNAQAIETALRRVWSCARAAPVFSKSGKSGSAEGRLRANPLLSKHAVNVALAGAALLVQKQIRAEAAALRIKIKPEARDTPFVPEITTGAVVMVEQFIAAVVQQGVRNAGVSKECEGTAKVSFDQAAAGMATAAQDVLGSALPALLVLNPHKKRQAKAPKRVKVAKPAAAGFSEAAEEPAAAEEADEISAA